jgi:diadenosine tetraphosphatase ApaH/serine/threonine PP2A family protein phosphatase
MRYLVLSDIHSNLEAFEAVLADAGLVDQVWCLGDVVGYGPDPNACIELLETLPYRCVAGNHDWATLGKLNLDDFNPDARDANLWNRKQLTPGALAFLEGLPEMLVEGEFTLVHGSPRHPIWEYILYPSTAQGNFEYFDTEFCLVGHTHTPAIYRLRDLNGETFCESVPPTANSPLTLGQERLIVNPGSVGQPRDGNPEAGYAILDLAARTLEHRRVTYPIEKTQSKMMDHNLPLRLVLRLAYGW